MAGRRLGAREGGKGALTSPPSNASLPPPPPPNTHTHTHTHPHTHTHEPPHTGGTGQPGGQEPPAPAANPANGGRATQSPALQTGGGGGGGGGQEEVGTRPSAAADQAQVPGRAPDGAAWPRGNGMLAVVSLTAAVASAKARGGAISAAATTCHRQKRRGCPPRSTPTARTRDPRPSSMTWYPPPPHTRTAEDTALRTA